jgi:hypothetical protein
VDHAFELIVGTGAVPTNTTTSKADQLHYVCDGLGRLVSQREVELLFRVTSATAKSIKTAMLATYEEALHEKFVARMRGDAKVLPSGNDDAGLTWTLRFTESGSLETAWSELLRLGVAADCDHNPPRRTVTVPRTVAHDGRTPWTRR